jgi:hypothetical protein
MAKVAPVPVERQGEAPQFVGIVAAKATLTVSPSRRFLRRMSSPLRRKSTEPRFQGQSDVKKNEARTFRALSQLHYFYALLATIVVCTLLMLVVGVPYAANERMADAPPGLQTAIRGLIVGIWMYVLLGPIFLVNAPTIVRGGFHPRFLLSLPLTLGPAVGVAFIPVAGSTLGITAIAMPTLGISFVLCVLLLNTPFFATDEHKALDQSCGAPLLAIGVLFFGLVTAHATLIQLYSGPLVGILLPTGSAVTRQLAIVALGYSFHTFYFEPKQAFLQLSLSEQSQANVVPPLLGDIEATFGYLAAFFALIIGNAASVATIVEAMLAPASTAWVLTLVVSLVPEVAVRTGIQQRFELWVAAKLAAKLEIQWPVRLARMSALKLVYLHSLGGTGYVAPVMAVCIGCVRAATFGDATAIVRVWLDVSPTVWKVLLAQLASQIFADAAVMATKKMGLQQFELSARFAAGHPLSNAAFRDFGLEGYAVVFGLGGSFIYAVYVAFLGPAFVMGMCRAFAPSATRVLGRGRIRVRKVSRDRDCAPGEQNSRVVSSHVSCVYIYIYIARRRRRILGPGSLSPARHYQLPASLPPSGHWHSNRMRTRSDVRDLSLHRPCRLLAR